MRPPVLGRCTGSPNASSNRSAMRSRLPAAAGGGPFQPTPSPLAEQVAHFPASADSTIGIREMREGLRSWCYVVLTRDSTAVCAQPRIAHSTPSIDFDRPFESDLHVTPDAISVQPGCNPDEDPGVAAPSRGLSAPRTGASSGMRSQPTPSRTEPGAKPRPVEATIEKTE
jgi:hypothetical protein